MRPSEPQLPHSLGMGQRDAEDVVGGDLEELRVVAVGREDEREDVELGRSAARFPAQTLSDLDGRK